MKVKRKKLIRAAAAVVFALLFGLLYRQMYIMYLHAEYPQKFSGYVAASAAEFGVPEQVVYAVIRTESDFDSCAVSPAGAVGLMQLMPSTFEWLTNDILNENLSAAMLKDPGVNIRYGTFLLSRLYGQYGNWKTVFAAYNAGMGNVNKWLEDERYSDGSGNLTFIPFAETRRYVELADKSAGIYKRLYYDKGD